MNCTASSIAIPSACFACYPDDMARAIAIDLLCQWANANPTAPFQFAPDGALRSWTDSGGVHTGSFTLAAFLATADLPTVTVLSFGTGANPDLTSISGLSNVPALTHFTSVRSQFASIDFSGNHNIVNININSTPSFPGSGILASVLGLAGNLGLTSLQIQNQSLTTINVLANVSLTTLWLPGNSLTALNASGLVACTSLKCNSNAPLLSLNITNDFAIAVLDVSNCPLLNGNITGP